MITIGYSTKKIDPSFKKYIEESCGLDNVEVIAFENPGTHSLTEVYNIILNQSQNDIVVLCHDDIRVKTKKWGQKILDHFNNSDYGIIGVAGTYNFPNSGRWWENNTSMVGIVNHKHPQTGKEYESKYCANVGDNIIPVVSLDGVFMVAKKSKLKYNFDESINGFHFYDVDFTVGNYLNDVKIGVITNVRILHFSVGATNNQWEQNRNKFVEKWKESLPINHPEIKIFYNQDVPKIKKEQKVSVIILSKSANKLLFDCVDSFLEKSQYKNYEIVVGDTGSSEEEIQEFKQRYQQENIRIVELNHYHFATNNNDIVTNHISPDTELILFSNNDIKILNDVISKMVSYYNTNKNQIGTIGARLHFANNLIQHSGVICAQLNNRVALGHFGINTGYKFHEGNKEVFGNTAALMMINKTLFNHIGMFDTSYQECFEDVDLNNKLLRINKKNIFLGDAVAYHYESQTRNKSPEKSKNEMLDYQVIIPRIVNNKQSHKYIEIVNS